MKNLVINRLTVEIRGVRISSTRVKNALFRDRLELSSVSNGPGGGTVDEG